MKKSIAYPFLFSCLLFFSCSPLKKYGKHYQEHQDKESLLKVMDAITIGTDTSEVHKILGPSINFGFDIRYTVPDMSPEGCAMGTVFHVDENGKVDDKWFGAICE